MQEEVESKVAVLIVNTGKLTEQELRKALAVMLCELKDKMNDAKHPHGKMTVKQLAAQNQGMQSIEVSDKNIGSFNRIARKYGIDFAPFKVKGENKYLIFFKAPDKDAMTAAFKEYTAKQIGRTKRPSVLQKLQYFKSLIKTAVKDLTKKKGLER